MPKGLIRAARDRQLRVLYTQNAHITCPPTLLFTTTTIAFDMLSLRAVSPRRHVFVARASWIRRTLATVSDVRRSAGIAKFTSVLLRRIFRHHRLESLSLILGNISMHPQMQRSGKLRRKS